MEEILSNACGSVFSIFSCGCKQSNFSTQYDGKGIFFYNTFLKTAGFVENSLCYITSKNIHFNLSFGVNASFHSVP